MEMKAQQKTTHKHGETKNAHRNLQLQCDCPTHVFFGYDFYYDYDRYLDDHTYHNAHNCITLLALIEI